MKNENKLKFNIFHTKLNLFQNDQRLSIQICKTKIKKIATIYNI